MRSNDLRLAQLIDPAVPDMRPIGGRVLHQAHGAGRAGARLDAESHPQLDHLLMRPAHRQMQESERIENRMGCLPEGLEQRRQRGFGRSRAFGMAAHAVDDDQKDRLIGGRHRDAILVLLAMADEADVSGLDLQ